MSILNRWIGSVVEATVTPHPLDRYLELVDPMLTWRDMRARVVAINHPTPRTVRLRLRPTRQWRGHRAGQFVQLGVVIDGVRHTRCFSPANAACDAHSDIELLVTSHDDGFVSRHLAHDARVGDVLQLSQAGGDFHLPSIDPTSIVLVSGGSGITPVLSILRTLVASHYGGRITFVHYVPSAADLAYRAELTALAALEPNLDLRIHYTRAGGGHFTGDHLDGIDDLATADVFVCGPPSLMDAVETFHHDAELLGPLHREAFTAAAPISVDPDQPVSGDLSFSASSTAVANDGRTILDQAESAGLRPEFGCRMGICFSCTATKVSGCTRNVLTGETDSEADTQIQLCVNAPVGDVDIRI
ncbi:ferredoxin reductase [Gordonia sp. ABSL1-1]|uniref:ferredoxin reductase n=1 Tax=Gordonia sp. ABSL1-1 TaxID=3053923 RepID=UPI0025732462|nr:ferredoxin reductase [Gordonia sp. ABSL1-1]MDL9938468.1 ferredoxin reductase [Gordonia sp. ABSL1-1]